MLAGGEAAAKSPGLTKFSDPVARVAFSYPSLWRAQYRRGFYGQLELVVALSPERLHAPCRRTGPESTACGFQIMLNALPPGGVFVAWMIDDSGIPNPNLVNDPGTPTRIGGLPAKILIDASGAGEPSLCLPYTTGSVTAFVSASNRHGPVIITACTNNANFLHFKAQILAMLRSAAFR